MINYDKFFALLKEHNISISDLRTYNIISQSTLTKIRQGDVGLKADNLNKLCALLRCQPSDLFEYVPDEASEAWAKEIREKLKK